VLLLAGSATSLTTGTFHAGGSWVTSPISDGTSFGTSLTVDSTGRGVGAYTSATGATVKATIWSGGTWSAPSAILATIVARDQPYADATGGTTTHLLYQDTSYFFWYLAFNGTAWSASAQAVGGYYGPVPATIAARGTDATAGFIDGESAMVNEAAQADLTGGVWEPRDDVSTPASFTIPAQIIPLSATPSGPELMMVFVQGSQILFTTRTGTGTSTAWSTPAAINNCLTGNRVGLAPLPDGGAILAFRGQDTNLYWTVFSGGATGTWSAVAALSSPNVSITAPPAVTHGISGDVAEIAFIQSDGMAHHARLTGTTWSTPVTVGGASLTGVALASAP
jgi:hypothetical protein